MGQGTSKSHSPWRQPPTGDFLDQPIECGPQGRKHYLVQELGKGAFGVAYLAVRKRESKDAAPSKVDDRSSLLGSQAPLAPASDLESGEQKQPALPCCRDLFLEAKQNYLVVIKRFRHQLDPDEARKLTPEQQRDLLAEKRAMFGQEREHVAWVKGSLERSERGHSNLVRYIMDFRDDETNSQAMLFQYCNLGDIRRLVNRCRDTSDKPKQLSRDQVLQICVQLANGVAQLHYVNIIHRDLALRNCFVHSEDGKEITFLIGDFGLCVDVGFRGGTATESFVRGPHVPNEPASEQSDVYALGLLFYELMSLVDLSRDSLYEHDTTSMAAAVYKETDLQALTGYGPAEKDIVKAMISSDVKQRPSAQQVYEKLKALLGQKGLKWARSLIQSVPTESSVEFDRFNRAVLVTARDALGQGCPGQLVTIAFEPATESSQLDGDFKGAAANDNGDGTYFVWLPSDTKGPFRAAATIHGQRLAKTKAASFIPLTRIPLDVALSILLMLVVSMFAISFCFMAFDGHRQLDTHVCVGNCTQFADYGPVCYKAKQNCVPSSSPVVVTAAFGFPCIWLSAFGFLHLLSFPSSKKLFHDNLKATLGFGGVGLVFVTSAAMAAAFGSEVEHKQIRTYVPQSYNPHNVIMIAGLSALVAIGTPVSVTALAILMRRGRFVMIFDR